MKKLSVILMAVSLVLLIAGCSKKAAASSSQGKLSVVATIFPLYDWAKNVTAGANNVNLELLVKNGVDLHSFQPSAQDMIKISDCDVLIYAGGESDQWVKDALKNARNKNMVVINLMEKLAENVKTEEITEGMQTSSESEGGEEKDEHFWLSLVNAKLSCQEIASVLSNLDPAESSLYKSNLASYTDKIDGVWGSCVTRDRKFILVCDRFPFRYMTDELGALYFAAFASCSAETEASFETVKFLSDKVNDLGLTTVFVTESSDKKIARTVINNAGLTEADCKIVVLDAMQTTTLEQANAGKNYIDVMKDNFTKIAQANK